MPTHRIWTSLTPRIVAVGVVGAALAALVAAPHAASPRPDPFDDPPPLSAPAPVAHNPDPAVIGPARDL